MDQDVDCENLGKKHRNYNKLLKELINVNKSVSEIKLKAAPDIENLLKIDVASYNRDVDYIIQVLKSDDMLYVSRALSKCMWLITDPQYSHIIHPEYISTELSPNMTTKARIKLIKHISHNLKDESRAELFYMNEKKPSDAVKWLPYCSVPFIEQNITKHVDHLQSKLFKRLCAKSITIFEIIFKEIPFYEKSRYAKEVMFFLNTDVDKYLDIVTVNEELLIKFTAKATDLIMKQSPKRMTDNFGKYWNNIDLKTFAKHLSADEVKSFLYAQTKTDYHSDEGHQYLRKLFTINNLKLFIKRLPRNEQYDFVKQLFISKAIADETGEKVMTENEKNMKKLSQVFHTVCPDHLYEWYEFAPFDEAFEAITALIDMDIKEHGTTFTRLSTLVRCASRNMEHVNILLKYYINRNKVRKSKFKLDFVVKLLKLTQIQKYDDKTWNMINELLKGVNIYQNSRVKPFICAQSIVYYVINDQKVPEEIEKEFSFVTLKTYRNKLNKEQGEKIFLYLYESLLRDLRNPIKNENEFSKFITTLNNIGKLFKDWDKKLQNYPLILEKINEIIKIKKESFRDEDLSSLYKLNKTWRRHMFEDSLTLYPNEEVCINALKHDPTLLTRNEKEVTILRTNDSISLIRFLDKMRIYWPTSLTPQWRELLQQQLNESKGQKAAARGLCIILPHETLLQIISKYKPEKARVDWSEIDDIVFSIQQQLAKTMHVARPQPPPDMVLPYAKGDYLKFALPSLLAIFYNIRLAQCEKYIPVLIDAPVSVQKHGIRLAFQRLDQELIKNIFINRWKMTKNVSIRVIIFKFTFKMLTNEKDEDKAVALWEILELFIENLTFEEDKKIYSLLSNVEEVPLVVRSKFLIKSYKFLQKLILNLKETERSNYEWQRDALVRYSREIMENINQDFVIELIEEFITKDSSDITQVISSYLLCAKDENIQDEKYKKVLAPFLHEVKTKWEEKRSMCTQLLARLSIDLKEYVIVKDMITPVKMFVQIQNELENVLNISDNYVILTRWKLIVALTKLIKEARDGKKEWNELCDQIAPLFGKVCLVYLKEDVSKHFTCIYIIFSKIIDKIFSNLNIPDSAKLQVYNCLTSDKDFVQGFLATIEINEGSSRYRSDTSYKPLWQELSSHPSVEVKMHFYNRIGREVLCEE